MNGIHRIGVMTAGGDCPGLNAVIRAVTKPALAKYNLEVMGIEDGFLGLIQNRMWRLNNESVSNILTAGGTILGTNNKTDPHRFPVDVNGVTEFRDVTGQCLENIAQNKLDALVVIGGDGSMSIASGLARLGVNCIGVPKTIDNDLWGTDVTFGFATAVSIATDALDRVHTTAASHHRVIVVEVMGRNAGWIALHSGMASGSDVILIPEIPYDFNAVHDFVLSRSNGGNVSALFACPRARDPQGRSGYQPRGSTSPEPVRLGGIGQKVAQDIEVATGIETRAITLGHIQRGGTPVATDRVLATEFGNMAIELLDAGARARLVVMKGRTITHIPIEEAEGKQRFVPVDHPLVRAARNVGTCFG